MPELENNAPVDPIILAAMVEDPDETEDEKKMREELLGTTDTTPGKGTPSSDNDDEEDEDEDDPDKKKKSTTDEEDDDDQENDDPNKPKPKRPVEAKDDEEEDEDQDEDEDDPDKKKSRKEKRQERKEDFLQSIRKDNAKDPRRANIPNYDPLNYEEEDGEGNPRSFKPDELKRDREMVGAVGFAKGVDEARYWNEQDNFWRDLGSETKILSYDPKLSFLTEKTADGKENPDFDPDRTEEINARFLQMVGFQQFYRTDPKTGQVLYDRATNQPIVVNTVGRTDLSYEKFARAEVQRMERWASKVADDREDETRSNVTKQRTRQGIRPNGGKRKSLGALNPGDISRMSDAELEKNEAAIDAQIDAMLGI